MTALFIDASAFVALLSVEPEAERISAVLADAEKPFTTALAVLEAALALSRPDKWNVPIAQVEHAMMEIIEQRGIVLRELPIAKTSVKLSIEAAARYRTGRHGLDLADCLHYATAKYYRASVLATDDEFRQTDLTVIP